MDIRRAGKESISKILRGIVGTAKDWIQENVVPPIAEKAGTYVGNKVDQVLTDSGPSDMEARCQVLETTLRDTQERCEALETKLLASQNAFENKLATMHAELRGLKGTVRWMRIALIVGLASLGITVIYLFLR
jgi:UDP-N-acetylglucosamine 2-epimerase